MGKRKQQKRGNDRNEKARGGEKGKAKNYPKIHPTQKPVPVLKELIEIFTDKGDVVLDPCCGSGSTLRACFELGRDSYGFEIKKEFYNEAKEKMLKDCYYKPEDKKVANDELTIFDLM